MHYLKDRKKLLDVSSEALRQEISSPLLSWRKAFARNVEKLFYIFQIVYNLKNAAVSNVISTVQL